MDEPASELNMFEHFIINEEDEEHEEDGAGSTAVKQPSKQQHVAYEMEEGIDTVGDDADEEAEEEDEGEEDEDDDEEEDEKMSISDFSVDAEYAEY